MPTTLNDILKGLRGNNFPAPSISTARILARTPVPSSVEYFFDILDANSAQPIESQILSIKQRYEGSDDDFYLPYQVDDMNEAIDLCRQFCQDIDVAFTEANEVELRRKTNSDRIYLLIIERIIYTG